MFILHERCQWHDAGSESLGKNDLNLPTLMLLLRTTDLC